MQFKIEEKDYEVLKKIGIDVFPEDRNYWFIRTQGGTYYDSFVNEGFVGIEWDEISDLELIKNSNEEKLKLDVIKYYPKVEKPGHPVNQILRFANDIKKGDIVLIPNERSEWISIGEFLSDEMYIYEEEEDFQDILDSLDDDCKDKKPVLKKRREVRWIKQVKRNDLDPYLYRIIYSHNAVCDANKYSIFIDRTLSQFYIKGEEAYFTYKVNKKQNIPYQDLISFLNVNNQLMQYINENIDDEFNIKDFILKINVQSKGPIQFKGKVFSILLLGMVITGLFGAKFKFNVNSKGADCEISTEGLPKLIESVSKIMDKREDEDLTKIKKSLNESGEKLEVSTPNINSTKDKEIVADDELK
ncbi:hypothetical protein FDG04_02450 [Clostridium sporogenes]|uniref:hypothetical protein n=1 Tax=Clostridium sporogenes TaxID=1509 RepID=UPI0013D0655C|nr:hypothetical protein [Clostridium sporogenes]NFQ84194.1 hypothetical protein [Clostridium sporogenes]